MRHAYIKWQIQAVLASVKSSLIVTSYMITCLSAAIQFIYIYYKNHFVIFLNQCL